MGCWFDIEGRWGLDNVNSGDPTGLIGLENFSAVSEYSTMLITFCEAHLGSFHQGFTALDNLNSLIGILLRQVHQVLCLTFTLAQCDQCMTICKI